MITSTTAPVSTIDHFIGTISSSGNTIVFQWRANDVVEGDTNGSFDIFVSDVHFATPEEVAAILQVVRILLDD